MDGLPQHHISLRKRLYGRLEAYPHPNKLKRRVDDLAYIFGIAIPLFTIPQLYEIWSHHNAGNNSLITWGAFSISSLFWLFYGILHKVKPVIISQSLWFILQLLIVIGILLYN